MVVSVAARLAWTYLAPNGANFVDLHVYIKCAARVDYPGTLYNCVYADQTPDFPLPFTYPPFAAVIFYPLHLLPFGLVAFCWQVGMMAETRIDLPGRYMVILNMGWRWGNELP